MPLINRLKNSAQHYGLITIALHWWVALIVIGLYPLGLYIDSLSYYDPAYRTVPHWHKSIGLLLAAIMLVRIVWRFCSVQPAPLASHSLAVQRLAKAGHLALYLLILLVLASGYLISTADGRAIEVFNWFSIPALPALIEQQEDVAGEIHFIAATTLIIMASAHALAALKHHFFDHDQTLTRMLGNKEKP